MAAHAQCVRLRDRTNLGKADQANAAKLHSKLLETQYQDLLWVCGLSASLFRPCPERGLMCTTRSHIATRSSARRAWTDTLDAVEIFRTLRRRVYVSWYT